MKKAQEDAAHKSFAHEDPISLTTSSTDEGDSPAAAKSPTGADDQQGESSSDRTLSNAHADSTADDQALQTADARTASQQAADREMKVPAPIDCCKKHKKKRAQRAKRFWGSDNPILIGHGREDSVLAASAAGLLVAGAPSDPKIIVEKSTLREKSRRCRPRRQLDEATSEDEEAAQEMPDLIDDTLSDQFDDDVDADRRSSIASARDATMHCDDERCDRAASPVSSCGSSLAFDDDDAEECEPATFHRTGVTDASRLWTNALPTLSTTSAQADFAEQSTGQKRKRAYTFTRTRTTAASPSTVAPSPLTSHERENGPLVRKCRLDTFDTAAGGALSTKRPALSPKSAADGVPWLDMPALPNVPAVDRV